MRKNEKTRVRRTAIELIEQDVIEAEETVKKSKAKYEADLKLLKEKLEKRDAMRKEQLMKEIAKSSRTYEEIIQFIRSNQHEEVSVLSL